MGEKKSKPYFENGLLMLDGKPFTGSGIGKRGFSKEEIETQKEKLDELSPELKSGENRFKIDIRGILEEHKVEYSYKDGKMHGINRDYYPNGTIRRECNYDMGLKNGVEKLMTKDGNIMRETNYVNGVNHGIEKIYNEGVLDTETEWSNNEIISLKGYFEGRLSMYEEYENGQITKSEFY